MSMEIVPDCSGLYRTLEDVLWADVRLADALATPDPLLAIVASEARRIEHPAVRCASAIRTRDGVELRLDFVPCNDWAGLDLCALIDRVRDAIRRGIPDLDTVVVDHPMLSLWGTAMGACGRGLAGRAWWSATWQDTKWGCGDGGD